MKNYKLIALLFVAILSTPGHSADKVGNGGDIIRAAFIATGMSIWEDLTKTPEGQGLAKQYAIDTNKIRQALSIDFIKVKDEPLKDNGGSLVDAIGSPQGIDLSASAWKDHVLKSADLRKIVFHELLRAQSINDDNYQISALLFPAKIRGSAAYDGAFQILREDFENLPVPDMASMQAFVKKNGGKKFACGYATTDSHQEPKKDTEWLHTINPVLFVGRGMQITVGNRSPSKTNIYAINPFGLATKTGLFFGHGSVLYIYEFIRFSTSGWISEEVTTDDDARNGDPNSISIPSLFTRSYNYCELNE